MGDRSLTDFFRSSQSYKQATVEDLVRRFPYRRFVLLGDSGEKDPDVYGQIARRFPDRIALIAIRSIGGQSKIEERVAKALRGVPRDRWVLFDDPKEIPPIR